MSRVPLGAMFQSVDGSARVTHVDTDIFTKRYFTHCMRCGFCNDSCCAYGASVAVSEVARLQRNADGLESFVNIPSSEWFEAETVPDAEYAGGGYRRTQVRNGACVFLDRAGRGCLIHRYCLSSDMDYHALKPTVCWLFPVTFENDLLRPSHEINEGSLVCRDQGPTLYEGVRAEIEVLFGGGLVGVLDQLCRSVGGENV